MKSLTNRNIINEKYLPCSKGQLVRHFLKCAINIKDTELAKAHLKPYLKSVEDYRYPPKITVDKCKHPCQIEKDERIWLAGLFAVLEKDHYDYCHHLGQVLAKAFKSEIPPIEIDGGYTWADLIGQPAKDDNYPYFLETAVPSPQDYLDSLVKLYGTLTGQGNKPDGHLIPYVAKAGYGKKKLEGATVVDCLLMGAQNSAIFIEAKVLSDISCQVTFDEQRNQIARNIDAMLEEPKDKNVEYIGGRKPDLSMFLLLTPSKFKENPGSRLYWYKYKEYKTDPDSIGRDLPHRKNVDWHAVAKRIGWATWEDFNDINKKYCAWLND